jgi:two-component system chemotaxis response regulator CheY
MRALVIDDSKTMRLLIRSMLSRHNYEVTEAGNGLEAIQILESDASIELAILDWHMPVMSGLPFIRQVRAQPKYNDLKVVLVTTEATQATLVEALQAGVDEYIMKPFTYEVIRDKLEIIGAAL